MVKNLEGQEFRKFQKQIKLGVKINSINKKFRERRLEDMFIVKGSDIFLSIDLLLVVYSLSLKI